MSNSTSPTLEAANTQPPPTKRPLAWRFWAAMLVQSALIVAVPFQSMRTYANGQSVTLQTAPVDPYDLIRGYSQTLSFEISDTENLRQLPGGREVFSRNGEYEFTDTSLYVTLKAPTETAISSEDSGMPTAWRPIAISLERPQSLPQDQVALKGRYDGWRVQYGLETYYMPEAQRNDINQHISDVQRSDDQAFVVNVKVDGRGNSVPVSLWVEGDRYQF